MENDYILEPTEAEEVEIGDEILYKNHHYLVLNREADGDYITFTVECQDSTEEPEEIVIYAFTEVNVIYS